MENNSLIEKNFNILKFVYILFFYIVHLNKILLSGDIMM